MSQQSSPNLDGSGEYGQPYSQDLNLSDDEVEPEPLHKKQRTKEEPRRVRRNLLPEFEAEAAERLPPRVPAQSRPKKRKDTDAEPTNPIAPRQESPAYHWCGTINNPGFDDASFKEWFHEVTEGDEKTNWNLNFLVASLESGKSGTVHIQLYAEFKTRVRLTQIKKLGSGAERGHWEKRRGTPAQARDYCMKPTGKPRVALVYIGYIV